MAEVAMANSTKEANRTFILARIQDRLGGEGQHYLGREEADLVELQEVSSTFTYSLFLKAKWDISPTTHSPVSCYPILFSLERHLLNDDLFAEC